MGTTRIDVRPGLLSVIAFGRGELYLRAGEQADYSPEGRDRFGNTLGYLGPERVRVTMDGRPCDHSVCTATLAGNSRVRIVSNDLGPGEGSVVSQVVSVSEGAPVRAETILPRVVRVGEWFDVGFRGADAYGNPIVELAPTYRVVTLRRIDGGRCEIVRRAPEKPHATRCVVRRAGHFQVAGSVAGLKTGASGSALPRRSASTGR